MEKTRYGLIHELAENYADLSEKEANSLATRAANLEVMAKELKQEQMTGLKRVLDGVALFQYYQIETKLDALFEAQLTSQIPLIMTDAQRPVRIIPKTLPKEAEKVSQ